MKSVWPTAARIVAATLVVTFILTLPLSLLAFNLGRLAFSPERMTTLLVQTIDETGGLRRLVMNSLTSPTAADEGGLDLAETLSFLNPQERDALGERLTPPGWAEAQIGSLVAGVYAWIDNDRASPSLVVDITDLKVSLLSGGATDLIEMVVDSWPTCSVEEIAEMGVGALLGEQSLRLCQPPEPLRGGLVGLIQTSVALSLRAMPDQIILGDSAPGPAAAEVMLVKERLRLVRFLAGWSWLLSPVMLGLVMALVIRSWRGVGLWWGVPLAVGALLTLATMVAVRVAAEGVARSAMAEASMPLWIEGMIHTLITAMMVVVFRSVAFQACILLLTGIVVLAAGLLLQRAADRRTPSERGEAKPGPGGGPASASSKPQDEGAPPSGMFG